MKFEKFDIVSIFPDLEALTPDGRWNLLQDWLSKKPKYRERAERWSAESVDQVFNEIRNLALDEYGALAAFVIDTPAIKSKLLRAIETLQACYQERQTYDNQPLEKEIKHVRTRRSNKSRSEKNHR